MSSASIGRVEISSVFAGSVDGCDMGIPAEATSMSVSAASIYPLVVFVGISKEEGSIVILSISCCELPIRLVTEDVLTFSELFTVFKVVFVSEADRCVEVPFTFVFAERGSGRL